MHSKLMLTATLLATLGAAPAAHAAFPGTNGDILFGAYNDDDEAGVYVTKPGGVPSVLTPTGFDTPDSVDVSPDGKRILWSAGNYKVWVADRDGTHATQITPEDTRDWTPSWGPDGTIVFAERDENNDWRLARMNADGTSRRRVGGGSGVPGVQPVLSPDGRTLAYTPYDEDEIHLVPASGDAEPVEIADGRDPEWTPDGRSLVYEYWDYEAFAPSLFRVDVADGEITPITEIGGDVAYARPSVSPDGKHIVAMSARYIARSGRGSSGGLTLRTMNIDGSDVDVLADTETARDPDWAPGPPAVTEGDEQQAPGPAAQQQSQSPAAPRAAAPSMGARVCRSRRFFTIRVRGSRLARVALTLGDRRLNARRRDGAFLARVDLRTLPKGTFTVKIRKTPKGGGTRSETRRYRTCVPKPRG